MRTRIIIIFCCITLCVGSILFAPKNRLLNEKIQLIQQLTHNLKQVKDTTSAQKSIPDLIEFIKETYSIDEKYHLFYSYYFKGITGYQVNDCYQFICQPPPHEHSLELDRAIKDYCIEESRIYPLLKEFNNQEFTYLFTSLYIYLYPPHERSPSYFVYDLDGL